VKKLIFLTAVILSLFSTVAAASAYEGHMVDVKAHVENALMVDKSELDFGTVFPEETIEGDIQVGLSESFRAQERYSSVRYNVYWEKKPIAGHPGALDPNQDGYFEPIWPFITLSSEGDTIINPPQVSINGTLLAGTGTLVTGAQGDECDLWHIILDPPVFDKWYNALTDPRTPSGILGPTQYVTTNETAACGWTALVPHADLGSNFKIQVTDIIAHN